MGIIVWIRPEQIKSQFSTWAQFGEFSFTLYGQFFILSTANGPKAMKMIQQE